MMRTGRAMGEFYTGSPVYARAMPRLALAALAASVLFAGCAPGLSFPNATAAKPLTVPAYESKPDGAGRFPAVVLMHGCHGVSRSTHDWARWLRERGYVALVVDSWTPRGVEIPAPGFSASVALYPGGCYSLVNEQVVRPLLLLIGAADDWTLPQECARMVEAMRGRGADATIVLYPGAVHYFDVEGQARVVLPEVENRNKPGGCCGATVGFDPSANADAHRRVEEFFGRHLGPR